MCANCVLGGISIPRYASVNSSGAHPPPTPGISGTFFLIVRPGGRALVYPGHLTVLPGATSGTMYSSLFSMHFLWC